MGEKGWKEGKTEGRWGSNGWSREEVVTVRREGRRVRLGVQMGTEGMEQRGITTDFCASA